MGYEKIVVVLTPDSRGFVNQVDLRRRQPHGPPSILSRDREMLRIVRGFLQPDKVGCICKYTRIG